MTNSLTADTVEICDSGIGVVGELGDVRLID